jgi:cellulose synthase/poly-beta-1,6-N-acetylglucosamine synthase-like glycosyltransferase
MMALVIASLSCVIWVYLLTARGGFWRSAQRDDASEAMAAEVSNWPRVVAVVPARDEAEIIGESIASLLQQDYRGDFAVIVVDDHSSDGTAAVAGRAAIAAGRPGG